MSFATLKKNERSFCRLTSKQSGQTLVEFILLLLVIVTLSYSFIRLMNVNLAQYWKAYVQLIVDDPGENSNINL